MVVKKTEENLEKLQGHLTSIREYWKSFLVLLVLCVIAVWYIFDWRYSGIIDNLESQKESLENELKNKDDLIKEYRERLDLIRPTKSAYSVLTNEELRKKGMFLVKEVRSLLSWHRDKFNELMNLQRNEASKAGSKEEKAKVNKRFNEKIDKLYSKVISEYDQKYKIDLILVRDEAWSRIPKEKQSGIKHPRDREMLYEFPTNTLGVESVINHFEAIVKLIP